MGALDGHTAIVTGGGSGIGEAICHRFAAEGAVVAVLDRRLGAAQSVADGIGGIAVECDVADNAAVERAVAHVVDELGYQPLWSVPVLLPVRVLSVVSVVSTPPVAPPDPASVEPAVVVVLDVARVVLVPVPRLPVDC